MDRQWYPMILFKMHQNTAKKVLMSLGSPMRSGRRSPSKLARPRQFLVKMSHKQVNHRSAIDFASRNEGLVHNTLSERGRPATHHSFQNTASATTRYESIMSLQLWQWLHHWATRCGHRREGLNRHQPLKRCLIRHWNTRNVTKTFKWTSCFLYLQSSHSLILLHSHFFR